MVSCGILDQLSGVSNTGEHYVTGPSGSLGDFPDNVSQVEQIPLSSYGISGFNQEPSNHRHNDLSSNANIAKGSYAPSNESSGKIADSINFEESPVLDFTSKDESRTHTSPIPSTSNAFADFESDEIAGTTVAPGDEIFGRHQGIASTESPFFAIYGTDNLGRESKINNSATQDYYEDLAITSIEQQSTNKNKQVMQLCFLCRIIYLQR